MRILNPLTRRLDEKKQRLRQTMNAKDAITAVMKEMLNEATKYSKAGRDIRNCVCGT